MHIHSLLYTDTIRSTTEYSVHTSLEYVHIYPKNAGKMKTAFIRSPITHPASLYCCITVSTPSTRILSPCKPRQTRSGLISNCDPMFDRETDPVIGQQGH